MGHHINAAGEFQSDKHPDLPPDRLRLNIGNPRSARALLQLAEDYHDVDREFADDLRHRVRFLHGEERPQPNVDGHRAALREAVGLFNSMIRCGEKHTEVSEAVLTAARAALAAPELGDIRLVSMNDKPGVEVWVEVDGAWRVAIREFYDGEGVVSHFVSCDGEKPRRWLEAPK